MEKISPKDVVRVGEDMGYEVYAPERNATIYLRSVSDPNCKVNVFYTTGGLMTVLDHPKGRNALWRSSAFENVYELMELLMDPRMHTSYGYRKSSDATSGCTACGERKKKKEFSSKQWSKRKEDKQKCLKCVENYQSSKQTKTSVNDMTESIEKMSIKYEAVRKKKSAPLTEAALVKHNLSAENFERRQFNCPRHTNPFIFFKKVPKFKPVAKCPRCKKDDTAPQRRLKPIPIEEEKGFGLFKCPNKKCGSTWGSSRACRSFSQDCHDPLGVGCTESAYAFRIDKLRPPRFKTDADGNRYRFRKNPPMPSVQENDEESYNGSLPSEVFIFQDKFKQPSHRVTDSDGSYDFMSSDKYSSDDGSGSWEVIQNSENSSQSERIDPVKISHHHCSGCATGACKSRIVPYSEEHDSTGSTISSNTLKTFTTIDYNDYVDRDN